MEKILEQWREEHETDEDVLAGDAHYITHTIYIATNGDIIHERKVFKFDTWEIWHKLVSIEEKVLQKGSK